MDQTIKEKSLDQKIMLIAKDLGYLQKESVNPVQGWKYISEEQINTAIKPLLLKYGVCFKMIEARETAFVPITRRTSKGNYESYLTKVHCCFEVTNLNNEKEKITIVSSGQGLSNDDKGVYTAITGARKYAIFNLFLISAGDDPERA